MAEAKRATKKGVAAEPVEPQTTNPDWGFFRLVWSDYRFHYRYRQQDTRTALLLMVPRILLNASIQFAILVRAAQRGPSWVARIVAYLQVLIFSSEVFAFHQGPGLELGAGIDFPHPYGVMIGPGSVIGSRVSIYHHTMIGTDRRWYPGDELRAPVIGDDCVVGGASRVLGPHKLHQGVVIGLNVFVSGELPAWSTVLLSGVKEHGKWRDPRFDGREVPPPPELLELAPYLPDEASAES